MGRTGLYYDRARYYDPIAGRFLSEDPVAFRSGTNFYPYSANSPVEFSDPSGLLPTCHLDPKSRCAQLFQQVFHMTPAQFNAAAAEIPWFYFPSFTSMNNLTVDFFTGNGDKTPLRTDFQTTGAKGITAPGGSPSNPAPVFLGPDWFLETPAHKSGTMLHEAVHSITGLSDPQIFDLFSQYGLPSSDYRQFGNTEEFTLWLMAGCPKN